MSDVAPMTPEEIAAAEIRAQKANEHVIELARRGGKNWTMRVPVDQEHDSDCVLIAPTRDVPRLIATIRAEQQRAEAAEAEVRRLREVLERWDGIGFDFWLCDDEWRGGEPDEDDDREWVNLSGWTREALATPAQPEGTEARDDE